MNKLVSIFIAMLMLGSAVLAVPVQATTYTITLTLLKDGEPVWTYAFTIEVEEEPIIIKVPEPLYQQIVARFGTDTFTTPFTIDLKEGLSLLVESDPSGLTIKFQPLQPGDINDDGIIDIRDIATIAIAFGAILRKPEYNLFADLNFDLSIDIVDLATAALNYGTIY